MDHSPSPPVKERRNRRRRRGCIAAGAGAAIVLASVASALLATDLPGNPALYPPAPDVATVDLVLVTNGFHTGLVLPRAELADTAGRSGETALAAVSARFEAYPALEFGWGEEQFYRFTPTLAAIEVSRAFRALFLPNRTVLHVVGLSVSPRAAFPRADLARISLSVEGFGRLTHVLEDTFAHDAEGAAIDVGPGLYGPSRFFRATGRTSVANVCNTWVGRLLNAAGLPDAPLLSIAAAGLLADLRLRSGVALMPRAP